MIDQRGNHVGPAGAGIIPDQNGIDQPVEKSGRNSGQQTSAGILGMKGDLLDSDFSQNEEGRRADRRGSCRGSTGLDVGTHRRPDLHQVYAAQA